MSVLDLPSVARDVEETITGLENAVAAGFGDDTETAFIVYLAIKDAKRVLDDCVKSLGHQIGEKLPKGEWTELGGKAVRRSAEWSESDWDHGALMAAVLDSVLADPKTGEIIPETEAEKIRYVWGAQKDPAHPLPGYQASKTALENRGITSEFLDEIRQSRFVRLKLEIA